MFFLETYGSFLFYQTGDENWRATMWDPSLPPVTSCSSILSPPSALPPPCPPPTLQLLEIHDGTRNWVPLEFFPFMGCKFGHQAAPLTWVANLAPLKWLDALRGSSPARQINCTTPCNLCNTMQYNAMQYDAMQYHAMQSKTIQYMQYKEIPCNTLFKSFKTSTGPMGFVFSSWMVPYGL